MCAAKKVEIFLEVDVKRPKRRPFLADLQIIREASSRKCVQECPPETVQEKPVANPDCSEIETGRIRVVIGVVTGLGPHKK